MVAEDSKNPICSVGSHMLIWGVCCDLINSCLFFARSERRLLNCHVPISQLYKTLLKVLAQNFPSFFMFVFVCLVGWFLFCFVLETHYYTANNLRKFFGRILCKNELSWTLALEPSDLVSPRRATKGPFRPRDRANSP